MLCVCVCARIIDENSMHLYPYQPFFPPWFSDIFRIPCLETQRLDGIEDLSCQPIPKDPWSKNG